MHDLSLFFFYVNIQKWTSLGFCGASVATQDPGCSWLCTSYPRAQPQPPGIRWSACHPGHVPGREWRKVLSTCLSGKFPTSCHFHSHPLSQGSATWPHPAQGRLRILLFTVSHLVPSWCLEGWGLLGQITTSFCHNSHDFSHFSLFYLYQGPCFTAVFASRNSLSGLGCGLEYYLS